MTGGSLTVGTLTVGTGNGTDGTETVGTETVGTETAGTGTDGTETVAVHVAVPNAQVAVEPEYLSSTPMAYAKVSGSGFDGQLRFTPDDVLVAVGAAGAEGGALAMNVLALSRWPCASVTAIDQVPLKPGAPASAPQELP